MINLLPEANKRLVRSEYRWRSVEMAEFVGLAIGIGALVLLIPSGVYLQVETTAAAGKLLAAQNERAVLEKDTVTQEITRTVKNKLDLLKDDAAAAPELSPLIASALSRRTEGVTIDSITFDRIAADPNAHGKITLLGIADTRDRLLAFVGTLEKDTHFIRVDSPIENLVNSRELAYTIHLYVR